MKSRLPAIKYPSFVLLTGSFRRCGKLTVKPADSHLCFLPGMVYLLTCIGECPGLPCRFQKCPTSVIECQHPGVGSRGGQVFFCQPQIGTQNHSVQPCPGVSLGLGGLNNLLQCSKLSCVLHQFPPQALRAVGQGFKFSIGHCPQTAQNGLLAGQ